MYKGERERSERERLFNVVGGISLLIGVPVMSLAGIRIYNGLTSDTYSPQIIVSDDRGHQLSSNKEYIPVPYGERIVVGCKTNFGSSAVLEVEGKKQFKKGIFTNIITTDSFDPSTFEMPTNITCTEQEGKNISHAIKVLIISKK